MLAFDVFQDGAPIQKWPEYVSSRAFCIFLADADNRPIERDFDVDIGRLACYCPPEVRRRLFIRYPMPSFGDPILRTRLLTSGPVLHNLAVELALGRLEFIDEQRTKYLIQGFDISQPIAGRIDEARSLAGRAVETDAAGDRASAAKLADDSLAISVPAGEEMTLHFANIGIEKRIEDGSLAGFKFGCTGGGYVEGAKRGERFLEAFNYATLPFYLSGMEPEPGVVLHSKVMDNARALQKHNVKLKGHPLVWTFNTCLPPHRKGMDFPTCCDVFKARTERDVPPFAGLIDYWDIINEAHDTPWANSLAFTSSQMIELTDLAARTTRAAAPDSKLVVNVCLPFGDYAAGGPGRATTLEYVRGCIDQGIDFDIIGIQFYFGGGLFQYPWDMLEISRILDEYHDLGKEIHITELGTPSAMGPDPNAMIKEDNVVGFWHKEWSQATQADWVEQFHRICMSKPRITASTWWSFSDAAHVFWPHGGLLDKNDDPKESFHRLVNLRHLAQS